MGRPCDNLSAWNRFADNHRGVAIRFQCGEYTHLSEPMAVGYTNIRPEITNLKKQLGSIIHNDVYDAQNHFYNNLCHKPKINKDEQEWRCFHKSTAEINSNQDLWFEDITFERSEVNAIYFGAFTPAAEKRAIYDIIKEHYAQAKVFQAKTVSGKYEIEFERIAKKTAKKPVSKK